MIILGARSLGRRLAPSLLVLGVIAGLASRPCAAQPGHDTVQSPLTPLERVRQAARALDSGDHHEVVSLLAPLLDSATSAGASTGTDPAAGLAALEGRDRAEAFRIYGLALFFLDRRKAAEAAFLRYLELDVDARLDPTLVPPEAVVFFEDVRSRHAAELHKFRPKPRPRRYWALNLVPLAGQIQNRQYRKAWLIGGLGVVLVATNVTTYFVLDSWCDPATGVCRSDDRPRTDAARTLRGVNVASGVLLFGLALYSITDGFLQYKRVDRDDQMTVSVAPLGASGGQVVLHGRF